MCFSEPFDKSQKSYSFPPKYHFGMYFPRILTSDI